MKSDELVELIDKKGHSFLMNYGGFVVPFQEGTQAEQDAEKAGSQEEPKEDKKKSSKAKK